MYTLIIYSKVTKKKNIRFQIMHDHKENKRNHNVGMENLFIHFNLNIRYSRKFGKIQSNQFASDVGEEI